MKGRGSLKTIIFAMVVFCMTAGVTFAEEAKGEASADVTWMSNYIWRGLRLSDKSVIQPSAGVTYEGLSFGLWANYDADTHEGNETDLTLSYGRAVGPVNVEAGFIYYALDGLPDTQEVYLGVGMDVLLSPSVTLYYDYNEGSGAFMELGVSHSFALPKEMSLDLGALVGINFNNEVMGRDKDGDDFSDFYNGDINASVSIPVGPLTVAPKVGYAFALSDDAKDVFKAVDMTGEEESGYAYGGLSVSMSF